MGADAGRGGQADRYWHTLLGLPVLVDLMTTPALAVAETDQISVAEGLENQPGA